MNESIGTCPSIELLDAFALPEWKAGGAARQPDIGAHIEKCEACAEWVRNARFEREFAAAASARAFARDPTEPSLPDLPGYQIVREVSRGGQGIVYEAMQSRTRRRVALKILRQDHGVRRSQRARFEREIEIAAALHHPGIVAVYDSIALPRGRHALVLEFVEGRSLDQLIAECAGDRMHRERCVELLGKVCEAIHYAHQRGVIHRDLKPSNILVDAIGNPRILDFGVACWFGASAGEPSRLTLTGEFAGTLAYAAPEQISGDRGAPDLRSDLYAIGVMLYQASVGELPYDVRGSLDTVIKNIAGATPVRPARGKLDEDLWIIISKALAKDPDRRYQSGEAMASDLRRYLRGETIEARRDSRLYVVRKALSRHRFAASGVCAALVGLAVFGATLKSSNLRLGEALRTSRIERARALGAAGARGEADELLWPEMLRYPDGLRDPETAIFNGSEQERRALWAGVEMQAAQPCLGIAELPEGTRARDIWWENQCLFVLSNDGMIRTWSLPELRLIAERRLVPGEILLGTIAWGADRGVVRTETKLLCLELSSGKVLGSMDLDPGPGFQMRLSPSGELLGFWRASTGAIVCRLPDFAPVFALKEGTAFHRPWLSASDDRVGIITEDGRVCMYQLPSGNPEVDLQVVPPDLLRSDPHAPDDPWNLTVTDSGDSVAIGRRRRVSVASLGKPDAPPPLLATVGNLVDAMFSSSGRWMLTASNQDSHIRVWKTANWREIASLPSHTGGASVMSVSPDEKYIASIDKPGVIRLWSGPELGWKTRLPESEVGPHDLAFDASSRAIWAACSDGTLAEWSLTESRLVSRKKVDPSACYTATFLPGLDVVAAAGESGKISILRNGIDAAPELHVDSGSRITNLRFSPDGRYLAASARLSPVAFFETKTWAKIGVSEMEVGRIATVRWSGDGGRIAVAGSDGSCEILNTPRGNSIAKWRAHSGACRAAVFSPDGAVLATGGDDGVVRFWNASTWAPLGAVPIGKDNIFCLAFHPDSRILAVGDRAGRVTQVGVSECKVLASFVAGSPVMAVEFVGSRLGVGTIDGPIEIWDFAMLARCVRGAGEFWKGRVERAGLDR